MSTHRLRLWAPRHARVATCAVAVVLAAGVVAAASEPTAGRADVIAEGPRADSAASLHLQPGNPPTTALAPAVTTPVDSTATTAAALAPQRTTSTAGRPTTTTTTALPRTGFVTNWRPGDPYPASWAAYDARSGMPPYPYVVPDVCRAGSQPWDAKPTSSKTVSVGGVGTITVIVDPCVVFARESFTYRVSITGPIDIWIGRPDDPNVGELVSPPLTCPADTILTEEPMDLSRTWNSSPSYMFQYWPPQASGVTSLTVPLRWTSTGSIPTPIASPYWYCTQTGSGTVDIQVPVVIEPGTRPQEMGGSARGPGLMSTG